MTPDKDAEIARLRRELEYCIAAARENGKERDGLAFQLGQEVAMRQDITRKWNQREKEFGEDVLKRAKRASELRVENRELRNALVSFRDALHFNVDRSKGMVGAWFNHDCDVIELKRLLDAALASGNGDGR